MLLLISNCCTVQGGWQSEFFGVQNRIQIVKFIVFVMIEKWKIYEQKVNGQINTVTFTTR